MTQSTGKNPSVVIIGDGISAEAMALAFGKAGRDVLLIGKDRKEEAHQGGLQLAPNGMAALATLGITEETLAPIALPLAALRLLEAESGITLATIDLNTSPRRRPYMAILREGFRRILADASDATGHVRRRHGLAAAIADTGNGVAIHMEDGARMTAERLIGCDGAGGLARQFTEAGEGRKPLHVRTALRVVIKQPRNFPGGRSTTLWLGRRGGHIVHYPLHDGAVNMVAVTPPLAADAAIAEAREMLGCNPLLAPLIPALTGARAIPLYDYATPDTWLRGRVVLAGDAAHPMPPHLAQGAGQSLVDAAELHRHLLQSPGDDLRDIFIHWSARRIRALRPVLRDAKRAGALFAAGGSGGIPVRGKSALRNCALGTLGEIALGRMLDTLWRAS